MHAERDLTRLLAGLRPELDPGRYVFTTVDGPVPAGLAPVVTVTEPEGLTLVVRQEEADAAFLPYDYVAGRITLRVHSALDAVGLTAAVARELADAGLSVTWWPGSTTTTSSSNAPAPRRRWAS